MIDNRRVLPAPTCRHSVHDCSLLYHALEVLHDPIDEHPPNAAHVAVLVVHRGPDNKGRGQVQRAEALIYRLVLHHRGLLVDLVKTGYI